jgi:hypothetical protein
VSTRGRITLSIYEFHENLIPPYCLMTGERTDEEKMLRFFWMPRWAYLFLLMPICLPGFIVALAAGLHSRRLVVPLSPEFDHFFLIKRCVFVFLLAQYFTTILSLQFLLPMFLPPAPHWIYPFAFFSSLSLFILTLILVPPYKLHVVHMSKTTITFGGVHTTFIEMIRTTRGIRSREQQQ